MTTPNILYIHSHDTGRYVQPYGYAINTPNIQQLAEEGVLFRQAFCAAPTCSPSRAALLTGTYPHENGMIGLAHRGSRLNNTSEHLASYLSEHGFDTVLCGVQHEIHYPDWSLLGYQRLLQMELNGETADMNESVARQAAQFLSEHHSRPFFLSCGFSLTHRTGEGLQWHNGGESPMGDGRYVRPPACLPDTPEIRRDFADFCVAATRLDQWMGTVFHALGRSGMSGNTLVVCTTDHGIAFPFMKCNLTDHGTGVMLVMRGPGGFTSGKIVDALTSQVDLFPTICEVTGLPAPSRLRGRSLCSLVAGNAESIRDEVFSEVNYHAAIEPMRTVRTNRYRYIRRFNRHAGPVLPNCDDSISKMEMLRFGWKGRPLPEEVLYDLAFDPNEGCNVVGDPAYISVLDDMRRRMDRWMQETHDPLLLDDLKPWPEMVVNPVIDDSPQGPTVSA